MISETFDDFGGTMKVWMTAVPIAHMLVFHCTGYVSLEAGSMVDHWLSATLPAVYRPKFNSSFPLTYWYSMWAEASGRLCVNSDGRVRLSMQSRTKASFDFEGECVVFYG